MVGLPTARHAHGGSCGGLGWCRALQFCLGYTIGLTKLRKCYSHLIGASILAVKAIWVLNGCLLAENAD